MELDTGLLMVILTWVIVGGGGGMLTKWAMEQVAGEWSPKERRYLSLALGIVIGDLALLAMIGMKYYPTPVGYVEWIEVLVAGGITAVAGQFFHGKKYLKGR